MRKLFNEDQDFWNTAYSVFYLFLVAILIYYTGVYRKAEIKLTPFIFFVLSLATFRLIRLFVYDSVTGFIRRYLSQFEKGPRKTLNDLLNCPWCTGVWMALVVVFFYAISPLTWIFLILLALAGAGSFIQIIIWKVGIDPRDK